MKSLKILLLLVALSCTSVTLADFTTIELASEVRLSDFRLPQSPNDAASFKTCSDCKRQFVSVTFDTRYYVNGKPVDLADFRRRVSLVQDRDEEMVIVRHHLEDDVLTAISINL